MSLNDILTWFDVAVSIAVVIFILFLWHYIIYFFIAIKKVQVLPHQDKFNKFGILIPARNESNVISNILNSFRAMDYPKDKFDVYVIVETKDDPTIEIVKEFGFNYIVRGDLTNRRTKGYALDDAYHYLKDNNLKYDAYMVFDADNIIESDYLQKMNDVKNAGYQVATGYRSFTNAKKNWVCATSATLFSFMNQFTARGRSHLFEKATLTGTGYYIDANIVDDAGGWIWNGMTEDVELTTYCYYHNIRMKYYPYAKYYDEQPEKVGVLHKQHIRWVWGFLANKDKFKYSGKFYEPRSKWTKRLSMFEYKLSIIPFIILCVTLSLSSFAALVTAIAAVFFEPENVSVIFNHFIGQFFSLYAIFFFVALFTIMIDRKNLHFGFFKSLVVALTYMFFFGDFFLAFFDGLFHKAKRTTWKKIEHTGDITDEAAKESQNG